MGRFTSAEYAKIHGAKAGRQLANERAGRSTSNIFSRSISQFAQAVKAPQKLARNPQVKREAEQNYRVRETYKAAPFAGRQAVTKQNLVRWAVANPNRPESRIIVDSAGGVSSAKNLLKSDDLGGGGVWKDVADAWSKGVDVADSATKVVDQVAFPGVGKYLGSGRKVFSQSLGTTLGSAAKYYEKSATERKRLGLAQAGGPGAIGDIVVPFALETTAQFAKSPKATIKDVGTLPEAIIGGTGQVVYDTVAGVAKGDYLAGPKKFGGAMAKDYGDRYGSLFAGDYAKYRKGLQDRESVFPEFLDASMFVGGAGAAGGRVVGSAARAGRLGPTLERIAAEPRPLLRTAGGVTKEQSVSPNIFRAGGQRLEDLRRKRQYEKMSEKAVESGNGIEGLVPNEGEVVPLRSPLGMSIPGTNKTFYPRAFSNQGRLGRKNQGRVPSEALIRGDIAKGQITETVRKIESELSGPEQRAFAFANQGLLLLNEARDGFDVAANVDLLTKYRARFERERATALAEARNVEANGGPAASSTIVGAAPNVIKPLQQKIDSIQAIDAILADPERALTQNLFDRSKEAAELSTRHSAGVNEGTAARRRALPQAELALKALKPTMREAAAGMGTRNSIVDLFDSRASLKSVERNQRKRAKRTGVVPEVDISRIVDGPRDFGMDVRDETPAETLRRGKRFADREGSRIDSAMVDRAELAHEEIKGIESDLNAARKAVKNVDKHPDVKFAAKLLQNAKLDRENLRGVSKRAKRGEPNYKREPNTFDDLAKADQAVADATENLKAVKVRVKAAAKTRVEDLTFDLHSKRDDLIENEQKYKQQFADDVAKEAERLGLLSTPGYFKHMGIERSNFSMYTTGPGIRYFDDLARTDLSLLKMGLYDMTPQAFEKGLMASTKRAMLIFAITDNIKTLGLHRLNNKVVPKDLTLPQIQTWLAGEKVNIDDYYFINPKKALSDDVLGSGDSPFFVDPKELLGGKENRQVAGLGPQAQAMTQMSPTAFADVKGWVAIPREAGGAALEREAKGSGKLGRSYDKVRAFSSWGVLALSPAWFMFQRVVDAYALTAGNMFNPAKVLRTMVNYPLVWHSLSPQMQEAIKIKIGAGMHRRTAKMGSTALDMTQRSASAQWLSHTWDKLSRTKSIRGAKAAPFVLFQMDNWFTSHVKTAQFITKAEELAAKERYNTLRGSVSEANVALNKAMRVMKSPATDQIENAMRNAKIFEEAADHVLRVFGDWNNLNGMERHGIARVPMFYTWIRFAARTLFHTLPVRHPLLLMLMLKMAQIHKDDLENRYGSKDLPSFFYGNVITEGGKKINIGRISPIGAIGLDVAQMFMSVLTGGELGKGPRSLITVLPPAITSAVEAVTGQSALTGADLKIGASTSNDKEPFKVGGLPAVMRTWIARFAQSNPLYASLMMYLANGEPISDDSLPGAVTKRQYSTPAKQEEAKRKIAAKGTPKQLILQRTIAPLTPLPDNTEAIMEAKHKRNGGSKKKFSGFTVYKNGKPVGSSGGSSNGSSGGSSGGFTVYKNGKPVSSSGGASGGPSGGSSNGFTVYKNGKPQ